MSQQRNFTANRYITKHKRYHPSNYPYGICSYLRRLRAYACNVVCCNSLHVPPLALPTYVRHTYLITLTELTSTLSLHLLMKATLFCIRHTSRYSVFLVSTTGIMCTRAHLAQLAQWSQRVYVIIRPLVICIVGATSTAGTYVRTYV